MHDELAKALSAQADHERLASASYLAMAHWCELNDFAGFADFFRKQSSEEVEHAEKIHVHLLDRGVLPVLGALAAPASPFDNLTAVAEHALALEVANTRGIHACFAKALELGDYPAQTLLHWFISEQVEEEAWASRMVALVKRASCSGAIIYLDRHILKELE